MTTDIATVAKTIEHKTETVSPGLPASLTAAHEVGEGVWQGDLGLEIVGAVPDGYVRIKNPTDAQRQLVPESGPGSHHRLASLDGVTLYHPTNWMADDTDLRGPVVVFSQPNEIVHEPGHSKPHGTVRIEAPMTIRCRYQRNYDAELRAERRAAD